MRVTPGSKMMATSHIHSAKNQTTTINRLPLVVNHLFSYELCDNPRGVTLSMGLPTAEWSIQPLPYECVVPREDGTIVDANESTEGARIQLASASHMLPLIRIVNAIADPVKRWLVPSNVNEMPTK